MPKFFKRVKRLFHDDFSKKIEFHLDDAVSLLVQLQAEIQLRVATGSELRDIMRYIEESAYRPDIEIPDAASYVPTLIINPITQDRFATVHDVLEMITALRACKQNKENSPCSGYAS